MNPEETLSVLSRETNWFLECGKEVGLTYEGESWYLVDGGEKSRRLSVYETPEDDIEEEWSSKFPDKPNPLAACEDHSIPDPGVLLLQAESNFTLRAFWFDDESPYEILEDWGVYRQPICKAMQSMRRRARWAAILLSWYRDVAHKSYMPLGKGFKRARDEFEETKRSL